LGRRFETGEELSLGEWQKIGLSRAFLRDSQLIILDEPASSLDPKSEHQMFSQFKKLIAGRSALLISHRLSAVRMADKIYVLSDGTITESGSHEELMQLNGEYAEMFNKQAAWYLP
jgi:ATP-binding cassette subfamily B protein